MKKQIKLYFENLDSKQLNVKSKIKVMSISKLGSGASNFNYLVKTNSGKFIFRINAKTGDFGKSKKEYNNLKMIEKYGIGPRVYLLDESKKIFDSDFIIIDYLGGVRCTQIQPYFDEKMIKSLARLLAKIHSVRIGPKMKKLDYYSLTPKDELKFFKNYKKYISKNLKNKEILNMIDKVFLKLKKKVASAKIKSKLVLSQGDFHKENIIVNKGQYYLIDFENLEITNQASALAHLFIDFKHAAFNAKQQERFLKEYIRYVACSKNIKEEIKLFFPITVSPNKNL